LIRDYREANMPLLFIAVDNMMCFRPVIMTSHPVDFGNGSTNSSTRCAQLSCIP